MRPAIYAIALAAQLLMRCTSEPATTTVPVQAAAQDPVQQDQMQVRKLELPFGFTVLAGNVEVLGKIETYTDFRLLREGQLVYHDSSLTEYDFADEMYPIVLQTGPNSFEALFEINDRPSKNYLKRLVIVQNKVVQEDKLPTFFSAASDLNNDGRPEYAGFWDYPQTWGENNSLTAYNPIIYYSLTPTGLKLDSALTLERNTRIYGTFHGYRFSEDVAVPVAVEDKFQQEVKRAIK